MNLNPDPISIALNNDCNPSKCDASINNFQSPPFHIVSKQECISYKARRTNPIILDSPPNNSLSVVAAVAVAEAAFLGLRGRMTHLHPGPILRPVVVHDYRRCCALGVRMAGDMGVNEMRSSRVPNNQGNMPLMADLVAEEVGYVMEQRNHGIVMG